MIRSLTHVYHTMGIPDSLPVGGIDYKITRTTLINGDTLFNCTSELISGVQFTACTIRPMTTKVHSSTLVAPSRFSIISNNYVSLVTGRVHLLCGTIYDRKLSKDEYFNLMLECSNNVRLPYDVYSFFLGLSFKPDVLTESVSLIVQFNDVESLYDLK